MNDSEQPPALEHDEPSGEPAREASWLRRNRIDLVITGLLWAFATVVIWQLAIGHVSPRRYQDEYLWYGVAKSFAAGDWLSWRGADIGVNSPLYPMLIAPAFWFADATKTIYHTIHFLDALAMTAIVFPVYFGARHFAERDGAIVAALLSLTVPAMNYAGIIGTESLAYPIAGLAMVAIAVVASNPTKRNWLFASGAVLLAVLARTQFVVLAPALVLAVLLTGAMRPAAARGEYFRSQSLALKVIGGLVAVGVLVILVAPQAIVGQYATAVTDDVPAFSEFWYWLKGFSADAFICTGIIPTIAAIAMFIERRNREDRMIGALLATALVVTVAIVVEVTWFSAANDFSWRARNIFYERYVFYIAPIFFIVLATCWRRITVRNVLIATGIAMLVLWGLDRDAVLVPFSYDAFGLTVIGWLLELHPKLGPHLGLYVACIGGVLGWVLAVAASKDRRVARFGAIAAILLTGTVLLWNQAKTWQYARQFSPIAFQGTPKPVDWIDRKTSQPVGMIITSTDSPEMYFQTEFWNDSVVRAFRTDQPPFSSPIMYSPYCEFDWAPDGTILGTGCDLVPNAYYIRSETIAMHFKEPLLEYHRSPTETLIVSKPPPRMISILSGRNVTTGNVTDSMSLRSFADEPSTLKMRVSGGNNDTTVRVGNTSTSVPAGQAKTVTVLVPGGEQVTDVRFTGAAGAAPDATVEAISLRLSSGRRYDLR